MRQKCKGKRWHFSLNLRDSSPTSHRGRPTRRLHSTYYWDNFRGINPQFDPSRGLPSCKTPPSNLRNSSQPASQSSPACLYFQWMKNEHRRVNKAIWPEGPGILRISVSCGEKMKHLPVCNPISWWLPVDIGLLRQWAGCSGCRCPDEKSSLCTGTLLRSDNGSQGNASTFGYLLSQIFPEDGNAFCICTTFHCNIHDRSHIVRPCIFHWLKTTIISTSLTAWMSEGKHMTEGKISPRKECFSIQCFLYALGGPPAALVSA